MSEASIMTHVSYETLRKPGLDLVTRINDGMFHYPGEAYQLLLDWEKDQPDLQPAELYSSTAITSGGYIRDPQYDPKNPDDMRKIIDENNQTAALTAEKLVRDNDYVTPANLLMTTEIGKVRGWGDNHYMQLWTYYLAGIDPARTEALDAELESDKYKEDVSIMNDRGRSHEERWPSYDRVTRSILSLVIDDVDNGFGFRKPMEHMLQLVDVEKSLGCRAERMIAEERDMTLLAPEIKLDLLPEEDELRKRIGHLASLGAKVGLHPAPARLSVVSL